MLAACVLVYAAQALFGATVAELGSLYGPAVTSGQWWRLFTSGFLHVGALHLAFNMFALFVLGRILEPIFDLGGRWRFPMLYLGSLLGGSLGALALDYTTPAIGASGAIYGLLGAALSLPRRWGLGWNAFGVVPWVVLNVVITFSFPAISKGGHLGGLLAGLLLGWFLAPPRPITPVS